MAVYYRRLRTRCRSRNVGTACWSLYVCNKVSAAAVQDSRKAKT